jgi:acyl-CoA reductase-like NAD-dependent aldehyde dehydrogenase
MASIVSRDKAYGRVLGSVEAIAPEDVQALVRRAQAAQPEWAARGVHARAAVLARARMLILERMEDLAEIVARESGKTVVEAIPMEIAPALDACRWLETNAARHLRPIDPGTPQVMLAGRRHGIRLEPYGVVGVISPWNYPLATTAGTLLFNLVAGNAVAWKPSSNVPLISEAFRSILLDAGVPEEILPVLHGGPAVGEALVMADGVEKVFFTGSEAVGRRVMELAAKAPGHPRPVVLELGGKDAMLVLWDADLERAAAGAAWAGFGHAGQTCGAARRVYVDARVADRFEALLVERARRVIPGDPMDPASQMGAMAHVSTRDDVSDLVRDALARGARVLAGGPDAIIPEGAEAEAVGHLPATVLADVPSDARLWHEELFGPVIVLTPFTTEDEAVRLADATPFGLSASVWSRDIARAEAIAERLDVGTVLINDHLTSAGVSQVGWAGRKASGFGVTRSRFGLWECVQVKSISVDRGIYDPVWWHPYDRRLGDGIRAALRALYGDGTVARGRAVAGAGTEMRVIARRLARSAGRGVPGRRSGTRR